MTALAFKSAEEMQAHYAAVRARLASPMPPKPKPEPAPVIRFAAPVVVLPAVESKPPAVWDVQYSISMEPYKPTIDENGVGRYPKLRQILVAGCHHFNMPLNEILSQRRTAAIVHARQVIMWLMKRDTLCSLPEIGRAFGGKDHTTILHGVRKIQAKVDRGELTL